MYWGLQVQFKRGVLIITKTILAFLNLQNRNCCIASNISEYKCMHDHFLPSASPLQIPGLWLCRAVFSSASCLSSLFPLEHMLCNGLKSKLLILERAIFWWDHLNLQGKCRVTQKMHQQLEYRLTLVKPNLFIFILENVSEVTFYKTSLLFSQHSMLS